MEVARFDVVLVVLDPTVGSEIKKTRPCVVISPDESNRHIRTVIVAPLTTGGRQYPTRIPCEFEGKVGLIVLDQMRTIDNSRIRRRLGVLDRETAEEVLALLQEMFAP